ncbi:ABC transporter ATP-binding protein/permease [Alysiella filiformis]|uniref:Putative ATP-binding cassette transporter n=1 Tax=Alysiella filiformis DSM 16848 TaxID=1120981 RepID=A0A286E281_9NEIS|nr:ABC transporter ATP-binding protein/permease [Alysiella filiformis]QMT30866.1 ABC transporter ATP-binding protein/permease [Alysiella filiformis]UBQ56149.1 ABC transporter ATP-binding protein/permease [Alysiella filiformis DSM 16848]SOD65007.1 putative ATP-binding cassette transporter [Alysiella filiformis DSM 16848]
MQKWQIELYATPLWLLQTFGGLLLILGVLLALLRQTRFGRQFHQVLSPCLDKKSAFKLMILLSLCMVLLLTEVRLNVLSTFMTAGLLNALQDLNATVFWAFVAMNAGVVLLRTFNGVLNDFLDQTVAIKWSERLNAVLVSRWLNHKNYYRLQMQQHTPDNIDQRIQQDVQDFIVSTIEFVRGMLNSVISSMEFAIVLWGLAGVLQLGGIHIPKGLVYFVFVFVIVATLLAMWIGKPLIKHNYENEKLNGNYRYSLIRVRDHAESIAFYAGEKHEQQQLSASFAAIIRNRWRIAKQSVFLSGFNDMFSQSVQLLPVILQAPRVFAKEIKVGDVQQTVQVFARLQRSLSFFRLFYEEFTAYRARLARLSGFLSSMDTPNKHTTQRETVSGSLKLTNVALLHPNGKKLLENINLSIQSGDSVLIQGASGCGKTSLLRFLADLWTFGGSGSVFAPHHSETLFVPQRSYVPQGTLREAICYPSLNPQDDELIAVLQDCRLSYLQTELANEQDWQHRLSLGELQRIAFARILLAKPKLILLDEATAALDENTEAHLYRLIRDRLPESMIVSVGHRNTLAQFHQHILPIDK